MTADIGLTDPWIVAGTLVAEAILGYPARMTHPVVWIGTALYSLEKRWNTSDRKPSLRKLLGVACLLIVACGAGFVGFAIQRLLAHVPFGTAIILLMATTGLAQRSLYDHVAAVLMALKSNDIEAARRAVGHIVGRDVENLDPSGIAAAALESLAESFNDGIVAPAFWFLLGGLPGLFIYKAVNTADSMIGHKELRWKDFGWCAARTDDVMNFVPARLAGGLIVLAGHGGLATMMADARKHASPNAGWPEAAMAGALNIRLGGVATYDGVPHERPAFGLGSEATVVELCRGLCVYIRACGLLWLLLAVGGVLWRL